MTLANSQLREYLNYLIVERGLSKNTISAYERDLNFFISESRIEDLTLVTPVEIESYIAGARVRGLAESSIARFVVSIRNAVAFSCKEAKVINQVKDVRPPRLKSRLPKALTIAD